MTVNLTNEQETNMSSPLVEDIDHFERQEKTLDHHQACSFTSPEPLYITLAGGSAGPDQIFSKAFAPRWCVVVKTNRWESGNPSTIGFQNNSLTHQSTTECK